MDQDIDKLLTFEIKRELADRYFGFRKLIEEDKAELNQKIKEHSISLEQKICFGLIRIFILLKNEELIQSFLDLNGLDKKTLYDPYLTESSTIQKAVFAGVKARGITRACRFHNLVIDTYKMLVELVEQYREKITKLMEDQETISEEIKLFYKKHDLSNIMNFFRSLDAQGADSGGLEGDIAIGYSETIDKKMRVEPPQPIEQRLAIFPSLLPYPSIRKKLKKLIKRAYKLQHHEFKAVSTK